MSDKEYKALMWKPRDQWTPYEDAEFRFRSAGNLAEKMKALADIAKYRPQ